MTAMIHNSHLRNLEHFPGRFKNICPGQFSQAVSSCHLQHGCIIEEMNRGLNPDFQETRPKPETPAPFYVLSNRSGINGAACILYEDVLKNFADGVEKNLIILPSSIHEVLLPARRRRYILCGDERLVTHINRSESLRKTACPIRYISIQGKRGRSPWHPPAPLPFADLKFRAAQAVPRYGLYPKIRLPS